MTETKKDGDGRGGERKEEVLSTYCVPGISLSSRMLGTLPATLRGWLYHPHLVDKEAEAQDGGGV